MSKGREKGEDRTSTQSTPGSQSRGFAEVSDEISRYPQYDLPMTFHAESQIRLKQPFSSVALK